MDEEFLADVFDRLSEERHSVERIPMSVYGVFAKDPKIFTKRHGCLLDIKLADSGLVYIGKTADLVPRSHFNATSSNSTLRLSIGAIFRDELELGVTHLKSKKFRFTDEGERRLSDWMCANLEHSFYPSDGTRKETANLERELIRQCEPPLNLTEWDNPRYKDKIMKFRDKCRGEADCIRKEAAKNA